MRITGNKPITNVQGRGAKKNTQPDGGGFVPDFGEEAPKTSAVSTGSSIQGIDALLSLQEIHDEPDDKERATKRGHSLLDGLEAMRAELLTGQVSQDRLESLAREVSDHESSGDSDVDAVIEEIELRVKVELAKLGKFVD